MDQYFEIINKIRENKQIQMRIRCLLMDLIDLRQNKWKQRRVNAEQVPKAIKEFRSSSLGSTNVSIFLKPYCYINILKIF